MLNSLFQDLDDALLADRLARVEELLHEFQAYTREDYQAEVYSQVNRVLALGNHMQELTPIGAESPAQVGDVVANTTRLNQDSGDLAAQLVLIEDDAGRLYNLASTSQNQLRQQLRELILASNQRSFIQAFINAQSLTSDSTASFDFQAGVASLPMVNETELIPTITVGVNSVGSIEVGTTALTDSKISTAMVWNGTTLELIMTFSQVEIMNRIKIELDEYQGLEITAFTTSPDGTLFEDVLADLKVETLLLNSISGKFSGDVVIDFPPRHTQQMRLVLEDRVGIARIALRSMSFFRRQYANSGQATSLPFTTPTGDVVFTTQELTTDPLTSITHQISYNGVHFTAIQPGLVTLGSTSVVYRAVLTKNLKFFNDQQSPLVTSSLDPANTQAFSLSGTTTTPLGSNLLQRVLSFDLIAGPVTFREKPLVNTLQVQRGAVLLNTTQYSFAGGVLSFPAPLTGIVVSYQTSALGSASLQARQDFYSPYLYQVRFDKA